MIGQAQKAVQSIDKTGLGTVTIIVHGGVYPIPDALVFGPADSGSPQTQIIWENAPGETPIFSGGVRLRGWENTGGNVWRTRVPDAVDFENLYYNGARRLRPRLGGYLGTYYRVAHTVYAPKSADCPDYDPKSGGYECFDRFDYDPVTTPISANWKNLAVSADNPCHQENDSNAPLGDIELLIFEQFSTSKLRIRCIDPVQHRIYLTGPTAIPPEASRTEAGFIEGNRFIVENVEDGLTQPGQWFLNRADKTLTYLAYDGEDPNRDEVIVPQATQLLVAHGLRYVTFRGLTFEYDNYVLPTEGHKSTELEPDITSEVSFQNSQHITLDRIVVRHSAGGGLDFDACFDDGSSPEWCKARGDAVTSSVTIENSAFYDLGVHGVRVGVPYEPLDTNDDVPNSVIVQNNVVEGYGRVIPAAFGIGQGVGHNNTYTHNEVYDGYHCAVSISHGGPEDVKPDANGNADNTISYNHVFNLLQGIMNDGGSIRIEAGNKSGTALGNSIVHNRVHDTSDASAIDHGPGIRTGYGGDGIYLDNSTGGVIIEDNLVYRVSGNAIYSPHGPAQQDHPNIVHNNILAFARQAMIAVNAPYLNDKKPGPPYTPTMNFIVANNLMYFDRDDASEPRFDVQGGCTYSGDVAYTSFQLFKSNLYWRTDGQFPNYSQAFHVQWDLTKQPKDSGSAYPCSRDLSEWKFYTFREWKAQIHEDENGLVADPHFTNPAFPGDDYSLKAGVPGNGFVPFDPNEAGRTSAVLNPPPVAPTFVTAPFNPGTDF